MKILMMILMVGLFGCTVEGDCVGDGDNVNCDISRADEPIMVALSGVDYSVSATGDDNIVVDDVDVDVIDVVDVPCEDLTEVIKAVESTHTTYQFTRNECNTIAEAVFDFNGALTSVDKSIQSSAGPSVIIFITYSVDGFYFRENTIGRNSDFGGLAMDYSYINGDSFITATHFPEGAVTYIYDDGAEFKRVIGAALYTNVIIEVAEVISDISH